MCWGDVQIARQTVNVQHESDQMLLSTGLFLPASLRRFRITLSVSLTAGDTDTWSWRITRNTAAGAAGTVIYERPDWGFESVDLFKLGNDLTQSMTIQFLPTAALAVGIVNIYDLFDPAGNGEPVTQKV